jgi:2-methylcitrate dehydratase PrpD
VGGAAPAAILYGLGAHGVANALGVAASMASGIIEANRTGGTVKRMHCGWAAHAAVSAAQLVGGGFTGPPTVLEGRFGFFRAWSHRTLDLEAVVDGLGDRWSVPGIFFKPYPANHFTHAGIDAAIALRNRGLDVGVIRSMELGAPAATVRTIGEPIDVKRAPETGYMAQFSGPYAVVAGLLGGGGLGVGLDDFTDELARDPLRRKLMALVDVVPDDECSAIFPRQFPAVLRVRTDDGREVVERVHTTRGGPDRPLSFDDLSRKFADNAGRVLPTEVVERLGDACARFETLTDVGDLLEPLRHIDVPDPRQT